MKNIVITGSTRGIGFGLADAFLARNCRVAVSGRSQVAVEQAVARLEERHGAGRVFGQPCDVADFGQVQALWDAARERFGTIDIWVNNAGQANSPAPFFKLAPEMIESVVTANVLGVMYGSKVAVTEMLEQGGGQIYNMEGLGSTGRMQDGLTLYGSTKYGLSYFNRALMKEVAGTPVQVGRLSPGMVITDLLLDPLREHPDELERVRGIFNILADRVENVAPWLAEKMLANGKNGVSLKYMTFTKLLGRFLSAPFSRRDVFGDQ